MSEIIVRSFDQQIGRWAGWAKALYRIETLPKPIWVKILMGGRGFLRDGDALAARAFVFRQVSKRWQYLHDDEIAEYIEDNYGVECIPADDRRAAA